MKKKLAVCIILVAAVLIAGGKFAFEQGRDYVAKKMVDELAETEEVKKYKEEIQKEIIEAEKAEEAKKSNAAAEEEKETKEDKNGEGSNEQAGAGSFWSEPLVQSVYGRFSASEISTVSSMLSGGLTSEEKKYIKQLVFSRVSSAEISQIQALYYKYN